MYNYIIKDLKLKRKLNGILYKQYNMYVFYENY